MPDALIICGPTSSGKSSVALAAAVELGGEIVNADSRQIYRGMSIGTGMPSGADFARVSHHLYGFLDPAQRYSAARYVKDADAVVREIASRGRVPVIVGGTGFYIEALSGTMPLDRPPGDEALRARLRAEARIHPPQFLWEWLATLAPARAAQMRASDTYRVMRALELELVRRGERQDPVGEKAVAAHPAFEIVLLHVSRPLLRERIAARVRAMFEQGIAQEARAVRAAAPDAPALSGLGYAEALALLDGLATTDEAISSTTRRTQAYAKRQETWFRRMRDAFAVDAGDTNAAIRSVVARAREKLALA